MRIWIWFIHCVEVWVNRESPCYWGTRRYFVYSFLPLSKYSTRSGAGSRGWKRFVMQWKSMLGGKL